MLPSKNSDMGTRIDTPTPVVSTAMLKSSESYTFNGLAAIFEQKPHTAPLTELETGLLHSRYKLVSYLIQVSN